MSDKRDPRRSVDIEKLLGWAYRQELPKASILGWSYDSRNLVWDYGTRIDCGKGSGTYYASVFEVENPHEDALLIHETVCELDKLKHDWHEQDVAAMLLTDMPEEVQKASEQAISDYKVQRAALITTFAKIGSRPNWSTDTPELQAEMGPNGRPLWVVDREIVSTGAFGVKHSHWVEEPGYDAKKKKPLPGARMKYAWEPSLSSVVNHRADYCHWHASLSWLVEELAAKLLTWLPTGPVRAAMPWVTGEAATARVLPALERAA